MKKILCAFCLLFTVLLFTGCDNLNMNTVLEKPHFSGIVTEVHEASILVAVNEGEEILSSSDLMSVSLDVELKDGLSEYHVGDEVTVYHDGTVAETYPAQINNVYAILIINEAGK